MSFHHPFLQPNSLARLLHLEKHTHASQGGVPKPQKEELLKGCKRVHEGTVKSFIIFLIVLEPCHSSSRGLPSLL